MSLDVVLILCATVVITVKKAVNEYDEALIRYVNRCSVDFVRYCTYSCEESCQ